MPRRLLVPALVLAAGVLTACVPVTPPPPPPPPPVSQYCAPSTPSTAGGYKAAFDNLRKTYTEWASADGAVPVRLSPSRTLWLFGDTFIGKVTPSGAITPNDHLVSNSAVIQTGRCFKPLLGGVPLARSAWIGPPSGRAYWPASAVVNEAANRLYVFLLDVNRASGPVAVEGTRIATFSLSSLSLLSVSSRLSPTSALRPYGSTALLDGGFAYMYSSNSGNLHVARAPIGSVASTSTWQYWNGTSWSASGASSTAQPMQFSGTPPLGNPPLKLPIAPLRVEPYGDGYLGTAMLIDAFSRTVAAFTAPAPEGPWTYASNLATTPSGVRSYGAQTLFGLQGAAGPVLAYSTNVSGTASTIAEYGPRFVTPANLPPPIASTAVAETPEPTSPPTPTTNTTTLPPSTLPPTTTTSTSTSTSTTLSGP